MNNNTIEKKSIIYLVPILILLLCGCQSAGKKIENPIIDGYYADPSIVFHDNHYYIYATKDPWGGNDLAVFETTDFKNFTLHEIN